MIYAGITIGPLVTTLTTAKKERELWFSSYMFSWLMENFYINLKKEGYKIIMPTSSKHFKDKTIGIYPDRLVFTIDKDLQESSSEIQTVFNEIQTVFNKIQTIYDKFLKDYLYKIYKEIYSSPAYSSKVHFLETEEDKVINIIRDYLQVKWLVTNEELTLMQINSYLDVAEQSTVTKNLVSELPCDRCRILPSTLKVKDIDDKELFLCPICAIRFGAQHSNTVKNKTGSGCFPSLVKISAAEIKTELKDKDDNQISNYLEKESKYLSYFAVLYIDLDNVSKYLKEIENDLNNINEFSQNIENFLQGMSTLINNFGGRTIYAGGDDLLALIPIKNNTETLLNLMCDISKEFEKNVISSNISHILPDSHLSISAGISVQYYKHPLNDALVTANNALFHKARKIDGKNALCMTIRKHSGATFEFKCKMKDLSDYSPLLTDQSVGKFLQEGIYQKLANLAPQFAEISSNRIDYLIDNYFNESCHKSKIGQFKILKDLIKKDWDILTEPEQKINKIMNIVNLLRFAKLLKR